MMRLLICSLLSTVAVCFRLTGVPSRHVTHKLALSMAIDPDSLSHMIQGVSQYHDMNIHQHIPTLDHLSTFQHSLYTAADEVVANVSPYSKVDKTGPIGFAAGYIEQVIDFFRDVLGKAGIANGYGFSIIAFTLIIKALTLPLTKTQMESTAKMQRLTPLQKKIQEKYADDETTKNQLLSQLFQAAQVNPLAGCIPAFAQIPIFISLYRALTNLVAANKLDESFLWIPDLEGPTYLNNPQSGQNWVLSMFSGTPTLGWHDTLAFLSLPLILYISQSVSMKLLQPPVDPNKVLTDQEVFSKSLLNNLPFVVAFFSINVPAGLSLYWIINNLLTTAINVILKSQTANEEFPIEVQQMMELVESGSAGAAVKAQNAGPSAGRQELFSSKSSADDTLTKQREAYMKGFGGGASKGMPVIDVDASASEEREKVEKEN